MMVEPQLVTKVHANGCKLLLPQELEEELSSISRLKDRCTNFCLRGIPQSNAALSPPMQRINVDM
eukprot:6455431-Amphidinium_carterae.1